MVWTAKVFEETMRPYIDEIYRKTFSGLKDIRRATRDESEDERFKLMDKELAIDTHLYFNDGTILTFQEKTLRHTKQSFQQFTFEYQNDPRTSDPGEWHKLAAQLYFFGYANAQETGYLEYWILNIAKLRLFLKNQVGIDVLKSRYLRQNPPPAKANFFAIPFDILRRGDGVIALEKSLVPMVGRQ